MSAGRSAHRPALGARHQRATQRNQERGRAVQMGKDQRNARGDVLDPVIVAVFTTWEVGDFFTAEDVLDILDESVREALPPNERHGGRVAGVSSTLRYCARAWGVVYQYEGTSEFQRLANDDQLDVVMRLSDEARAHGECAGTDFQRRYTDNDPYYPLSIFFAREDVREVR